MAMNRRQFVAGSAIALASTKAIAAKPKYNWKMVTTWPKNFPGLGTGANELAKSIESLSGGRIRIKVYGAGEIVPALGIFDAVKRGTAELGHGAAYYWQGKHSASSFFATVPFGLNAIEMNAWLTYGGGQKLWDEVYAQFDLKAFNAGNTGVQMGGWFKKEVKNTKDFKGLKIRMPGLGGQVLSKLGATVVTLPGNEIFQALKSGTIDATEWVGPYNDLAFGLYRAAKFYYWPGWHEPGTTLECMINKKVYNSLPNDLKQVIEYACQAANFRMMAEATARNSEALSVLTGKHKVQLKEFDKNTLNEIGKLSSELVNQVGQSNTLTKKVADSYNSFKEKASLWNKISEQGYANARGI